MHEILILYILSKSQNTLYGISKTIKKSFSFILNPSFGTLQPALKRLEKQQLIHSSKFFSDGGKPSFYFSINPEGKDFLKEKITSKINTNPMQLSQDIKIKLICSEILSSEEKKDLYIMIKTELLKLIKNTENIQKTDTFGDNYSAKMVLDNSFCEYKNLYNLIEGLEKCLQ